MLNFNGLAEFFSDEFEIPIGTVIDRGKSLRASGLIAVGTQGPSRGARMQSADAINWLFALTLDHRRGDDIAQNVKRIHTHLPDLASIEFNGTITRENMYDNCPIGIVLDHILTIARANGDAEKSINVTVESSGELVTLGLFGDKYTTTCTWSELGKPKRERNVVRSVTVQYGTFRQLAKLLGPPD